MKTSRFLNPRLAATAFAAVLATAALAQQFGGQGGPPPGGFGQGGFGQGGRGGRGGPGMGGPQIPDRLPPAIFLVLRPEVAEALNLTQDQLDKLDEIAQSNRPQGGFRGPGGQGGPPQGGPGAGGDRAARDKADAAVDAKVRAVLTAAQSKRLAEIGVQSMGLTAALVPAIQTRLGLSEDQKSALKALVPARGQGGPGGPPPEMQGGQGGPPPDMQGGPDGPGGGGPRQGGRGGDGRRQQLEAKIATILTPDQKATLKALGGKPIQLQQRGPGGPGGPGGQGGPPPDDLR